MGNTDRIKSIIEALLMVSENGLSRKHLKEAIPDSDMKDINSGIETLKKEYEAQTRAFNIAEIAGKCRIVTKPEYMPWISNLYQKESERLSGPSLETLAIIAYKQPVTRAEVEAIRGVNVGGVVKSLLDKGLLEMRGRKDVIGRPLLYGTSPKFLEIFGLNSLDDLPVLREFSEDDLEYGSPREIVENTGAEKTESAGSAPESARGARAETAGAGEEQKDHGHEEKKPE
ncbi:MAG: SMC-Scp complex subunit ScpB [Candidatus Omnitrophica bacterium]|nr:SMC-Scp complex subunit ScpB [Candidatus Omnitrophota bacterium]